MVEKLQQKVFLKNDSLITEKFYDQNGNEKQLKEKCCEKKPQFKGGLKKYKKIAQKFLDRKKYKIKGTVTVDYTISVTGDLTNVRIYDILPDNIDDKIITFFKQIKGWNPACNKGRAVPIQHSFKLIFN